jgi:hypothetical protein
MKTVIMKYIFLVTVVLVSAAFRCNKNGDNNDLCPVNLTIISAQTPANVARGTDIAVTLRCSGSDLCYSFSRLEIKKIDDRTYEIRAKGNYPCGPAICAQAIYYADASVNIATTVSGQYVVKYYNDDVLFRADTVTVN